MRTDRDHIPVVFVPPEFPLVYHEERIGCPARAVRLAR
ncbi:hypothetical protein HMPREF0682_2836 [Propionibacterium acidifaciens F0233]|uniref:Uncharacterized protein n=1 Tax=Propionibacterium acidifaciens F0233 TaxID=553198 RepID=U2QGZ5_9ACTN|nr:hypothetical protein HMPREF0682_2836 [Propionibacterium acidifaciens F0233]